MRQALLGLPSALRITEVLRGSNNSTQYNGTVAYASLLDGQEQSIRIELSLREPLLLAPVDGDAQTVMLDPISRGRLLPAVKIKCMARMEAFAEKFRAALSRREAAIRDFFDLDYAVQHLELKAADPRLTVMVQQKLSIPGNESVNVTAQRLAELRGQLDSRLKPVLRPADFAAFSLDRAFALVSDMAQAVGR